MGWKQGGMGEFQEGGDICIHIAGFLCYIAATNTMLELDYKES